MDGGNHSLTMEKVEWRDQIEAMELKEQIEKACKRKKTNFIDDSFPHNANSIGKLTKNAEDGVVGEPPQSFLWLRPSEISASDSKSDWGLFKDPQPSDVKQGALGDCWLLSAMALIAERPDILSHIFLTKEYSRVGVYILRVCIDGEWKVTVVDDFFPCRTNSRTLAFGKGRKKQLWVPLIEKAFAKQFGSYAKLISGYTTEGLAMLTGEPCERIFIADVKDQLELWVKLLSAREASYILGCSCGSVNGVLDKNSFKEKGLVINHAYSIIDVKNEGGHRLLRIRNPWGTFVWKGAWSDEWPEWDPTLRARLLTNEITAQTGTFWMSFDDFVEHFKAVDIAKIRTHCDWSELRHPLIFGRVGSEWDKSVGLLIENPTELCFTLFQSGARAQSNLVDIFICVHKMNPDGTVGDLVCRSPRMTHFSVATGDVMLDDGQYIILCHSYRTLGIIKVEGCIVIHSSRPSYTWRMTTAPGMYTESLVQMVLKEGDEQQPVPGVFCRFLSNAFQGKIVMVDNQNKDKWAHARTDFSGSENVMSSRGALDVEDVVPPLSRQITTILTVVDPTQRWRNRHTVRVTKTKLQVLDEGGAHRPMPPCQAISLVHGTIKLKSNLIFL